MRLPIVESTLQFPLQGDLGGFYRGIYVARSVGQVVQSDDALLECSNH